MMIPSRVVLISLAFTLTSIGRADDGWWSEAGGIGAYGKSHPSIRMTSEDLKIRIADSQWAYVDVLFHFHNDGKATQVKMAFPEKYEMRAEASLDRFRTWVNNKPVKVRRKVISVGDLSDPERGDRIGKAVWLKTVKFGANESVLVRVQYRAALSGNTSGDRSFDYTLTTGSTWKGPIGICNITVSWPAIKNLGAPYLTLPPAKWQYLPGRAAVAKLAAWKPKEDLSIEMVPGFGNFWINGKHLQGTQCRSYFPTTVFGDPKDPLIRCASLDSFFGGHGGFAPGVDWGAEPKRWFGGPFTLSKGVLKMHSGKQSKLPRGYVVHRFAEDNDLPNENEFVYLKDLIPALGGTFRYNVALERVEITF